MSIERTERELATRLANTVLDTPNRDPDDDLSMMSRQFLRAQENQIHWRDEVGKLHSQVATLSDELDEARRAYVQLKASGRTAIDNGEVLIGHLTQERDALSDELATVKRERDEAREYGKQARLRENAAEDARIHEQHRASVAERELEALRAVATNLRTKLYAYGTVLKAARPDVIRLSNMLWDEARILSALLPAQETRDAQ